MTSEQSIGGQEPLNCQCEGLLVLRNKSDLSILFFRFENHFAFSLNNNVFCYVTLFPFTQTYTKQKHEVLDFINQMASVNRFVCFCPRGPIINMVRSVTAGSDSTGVMTAFLCIRLLVKYIDEIYMLFAHSFPQ